MTKQAVVTGATGFLGINLIKLLVKEGWQVIALHRPSSDLTYLKGLPIELVAVDFSSLDSVMSAVPNGIEALFHVAGDTNMWSVNNEQQYRTNVSLTELLVNVALAKKAARFIHTSSISAYGFHQEAITETTPSVAMQSGVNYLKTKYLGEQVVKRAVKERGLDAVILNPCAIIGPYDTSSWAQLFIMVDNGTLPGLTPGFGSYCHVEAVANAHLQAYEKGRTGENYILAGTDARFADVVKTIGQLLNKPTPKTMLSASLLNVIGWGSYFLSLITRRQPNMTPEKAKLVTKRVVAKSNKAIDELNYQADIPIETMLNDCYLWLKQQGLIGQG